MQYRYQVVRTVPSQSGRKDPRSIGDTIQLRPLCVGGCQTQNGVKIGKFIVSDDDDDDDDEPWYLTAGQVSGSLAAGSCSFRVVGRDHPDHGWPLSREVVEVGSRCFPHNSF
jgi:hypothetical protein